MESQQIHISNLYLFAGNPYLRKIDFSLPDLNNTLLITFYERKNRCAYGCKMILQDRRGNNFAFFVEKTISAKNMKITLPALPNKLYLTLMDKYGYPLEISEHSWDNLQFTIDIQDSILDITLSDGTTMSVPKNISAGGNRFGTFDHSLANYFIKESRKRAMNSLEDKLEFNFFPGSDADKVQARNYIAKIIGKSVHRCYLLDPYFSEHALFYAYVISRLNVPIRILGAAFYLKKKVDKDDPDSPRHAELLLEKLNEFRLQTPNQEVQCRVLRGGETSKLHDRYIVSDNNVYLLGSSFHEFGGRATTIIKVPAPVSMIQKADEWWQEDYSVELEQFVQELRNETNETEQD